MSIENSNSDTNPSGGALGALTVVSGMMGSLKEKWDTSGGKDVVSNVSSSLPQGFKDNIQQAKNQIFKRGKFRSPLVFFGIGEDKPFYVERSPPLIMARLQHNGTFFLLNYALVTAMLFVLTLLITPGPIIGLALLGVAWVSVIKTTQNGAASIRGIVITQKQASIAMSVISVFVLIYLLKNVFWYSVGSSGVLIGLHALFRDASMHKDEEDKVEMTGDVEIGESDSFLNPATES
mmetsp:Transcript_31106/g.29947  ORF Transcript_31106/g.29947 Transcript_31106/m.29947 type:complete len:235 (-) Transcript_31106:336-1040(-)|eukprot:CAMPEP_0197832320 /NCGR_PEP_ID=MMETSP1437-20131217/14269_1 /TAXON_ID=49252 ORGANISM="Eucampia antarctica, Strain CCMP1452" /NCGR_SAMPLE_ID=MMETSP1437 /ASSEMBLY_ACC=CAM_ASM_001096 /LENGTH=234 /DNA_ID=CAMNT_0043435643 /DNA_START=87 /DNA_END=791 /DNA_ORIENTATION=-